MKVLIFGGAGLLGRLIAGHLRGGGHQVLTVGRNQSSGCDLALDFASQPSIEILRQVVRGADVVVNAVGILLEREADSFDAVHVQTPKALFEACAAERVARVVQISALGTDRSPPIPGRYIASKAAAEEALCKCMSAPGVSTDFVIVRPGLLMHADAPSTRLFTWLAKLPIHALPGMHAPGSVAIQIISADEAAVRIARLCAHPKAIRGAVELADAPISYRNFLMRLRPAELHAPMRLPLPWIAMLASAWAAWALRRWIPQRALSPDAIRMLKANETGPPPPRQTTLTQH
jgi:nucleoside-diphosphate-sugar epimerase